MVDALGCIQAMFGGQKRAAAAAKVTPAQKAAATKMAKLSKDAKGSRTLGSFFVKK